MSPSRRALTRLCVCVCRSRMFVLGVGDAKLQYIGVRYLDLRLMQWWVPPARVCRCGSTHPCTSASLWCHVVTCHVRCHVRTSGLAPVRRFGQSCVGVNSKVYIFGGVQVRWLCV